MPRYQKHQIANFWKQANVKGLYKTIYVNTNCVTNLWGHQLVTNLTLKWSSYRVVNLIFYSMWGYLPETVLIQFKMASTLSD